MFLHVSVHRWHLAVRALAWFGNGTWSKCTFSGRVLSKMFHQLMLLNVVVTISTYTVSLGRNVRILMPLQRKKQQQHKTTTTITTTAIHVLYTNIDQTLPNRLHGLTHCNICVSCVYYGHAIYTLWIHELLVIFFHTILSFVILSWNPPHSPSTQ